MTFPIGKLPRGLTSLLGLRSSGETPHALADQLVTTLDATELFLLDTRENTGFAQQLAPVTGFNFYTGNTLDVPVGQLWYVWHYILLLTSGAGQSIEAAPAVNLEGVGAGAVVGDYVTAAANQAVRGWNPHPFWAGPGTQFGFVVKSVTGAPRADGALVITRLRV